MPTKIQVHLFIVRKRRKTQEKFHTIQIVHLMRETSQALPWLVTEKKNNGETNIVSTPPPTRTSGENCKKEIGINGEISTDSEDYENNSFNAS